MRKRVSPNIVKTVLIQSRRRCCVCFGLFRDIALKTGQIAHLDDRPDNNNLDNLAFMCLEHHDQYDSQTSQSKGLTSKEIQHFRAELYEVINTEWKKPVGIGESKTSPVTPTDELAGHYVREGEFESAELQVLRLINGNVRVIGLAIWGKTEEYGPNLGELDFEAQIKGNRVVFLDKNLNGEEYRLELSFLKNCLIAKEKYDIAYFGLNVSFGGEYSRIR
ncbi:MAG: hypothetical protein JXR49_22270 [Acidobacteria bacterium]|nr:hypothetical protein [Acidobacteriota bacterium]